jgi:acyl-coenzyme A synthetase/AMP-(fatty) acid ligase
MPPPLLTSATMRSARCVDLARVDVTATADDHHPDLVEASVVGRSHPDWGEEVVAFLVARRGAVVAAAELDRLCLDHIARFKRPRDYRFVEALPKNNYGKVLKTELRRLLQQGP